MKKFTLQDVDSAQAGQAIVGQINRGKLMKGYLIGFTVPVTMKAIGPKRRKYMEVFFRVINFWTKGKMWQGYMVTIDKDDMPVKIIFEEVQPRVYMPVREEDMRRNPQKTYHTFI